MKMTQQKRVVYDTCGYINNRKYQRRALLGDLASEQPTGAQKGLMEVRKDWRDYYSSTREGQ